MFPFHGEGENHRFVNCCKAFMIANHLDAMTSFLRISRLQSMSCAYERLIQNDVVLDMRLLTWRLT